MPRLTGIRCQCVACGQWFGAVTTFNRHRRGTYTHEAPHHGRRCLAAAEMTARGWLKNAAGF